MANTIDFNVGTNAMTVLNQTADAAANTAQQFTSAKAELRALTNQMLQMDQASAEFKKASARASELKDKMEELAENVRVNIGNSFEQASNSVSLFTGRLMGGDLKGAGDALTNLGGSISKISFKEIQEEIGGLIKGFANLAKSILANPILLLAGVIAVVVMNMDKLRKIMPELDSAMGGLTEQMKEAAKANEASLKSKQSEYDIIMASSALMKEQGMTEKEILLAQQEKAKVLLEQKKVTDAQNIANAKADLQRNENLKLVLKGIQEVGLAIPKLMAFVFDAVFAKSKELLSYVGITIDSTFQAYDTIAGAQQVVLDAIFGNTEEEKQAIVAMEQQAALSQTQLANTIAQTNLDIKKSDADLLKSKEQNRQKELTEEEKKLEAEKKLQEEFNQFFTEWENELNEEEKKKLEKEKEAAKQRLHNKQQELIELQAIIDAADEGNFQATLSKQDQELLAQQDYYFNLISQAEAAGLDTTALTEEQARKEKEIKDKYRKEEEAAQIATQDFKLKQLGESLGALTALNDAFTKKGQQQSEKQFKIQKALNLASAVVDTYGGINRALNDKTMPSTTARIIQASIVGAMGLANVLKISKTEYGNATAPSGTNMSAGGGGDGGTTAPSPANFAFLQNQPNQQQPPLQAYVVGTQVSSNLEAQQLIQNQSRLGG